MDSIDIELVINAQEFNENFHMHASIEVTINSSHPYEIGDIVDASELFKSMKDDGIYYLFTCCCGMADCSHWGKGIDVKHTENTITWTNNTSFTSWQFERTILEENLKEITGQLKKFKQFFDSKDIECTGLLYDIK